MKGRFLLGSNEGHSESNIYADKSSLVLDWLLRVGVDKESFALREVVREIGVSLGLAQRTLEALIYRGFVSVTGIRTSKSYRVTRPAALFQSWCAHYSIVKRCKMWTYQSRLLGRGDVLQKVLSSNLSDDTALALHSAAEAYGCKNTNLQTVELYLLDPTKIRRLERELRLEPQERGYDVLLIQPYYKSLLKNCSSQHEGFTVSNPLLTYLDLYHFPLRGAEQAEFMADRIVELKRMQQGA